MNDNYWMTLPAQEFREKLVHLLKQLNRPVRAFELAEMMTEERGEYCSVQRVSQNLRELRMAILFKERKSVLTLKKLLLLRMWIGGVMPALLP